MLSINPLENTERENYKLLIGSIIPRPIAFVTTISGEHVLNGAPFSYFNIVSSNPPMISLAIQRSEGRQKDTAKNILASKEFVVHVVDEQNVEMVNKTAANLPSNQSEVELANFTIVESERISVPGVQEAKVRMECVLEHSLELGGSDSPGCDLIIGKVIQFHIDNEIYEKGRIDPKRLGAVSRLAGHHYAKIGEMFSIERPK
ncbi:flavin reductase family protein [Priestia taiwanensis]|uniref:flavin reductase family protein n=1 Tax=Priestia taiwanensis TaxID=1347902 RepID=UPI00166A56D1|nr:flavin reductase family protein [Priestia taiwanensis]MBM7361458.1 flavin reductase (DIM6/NTAB) family NADH-FMN oxidoreductase RutF [Priestia taiwanensis]